ncbi:hypothetical protein RQP54_10990 [Curvibacter sp. APW13]|uniref:hypothetical protein n=1 Tax=Curvibacter sp. APW13 TaxID=3077236 RepID=UPI0028DF2D1D|nr:hypothetical protein [Curvibacter sp. APW13]MDT8991386.1 hypothetical protein [Curvibacter sp. APW13]
MIFLALAVLAACSSEFPKPDPDDPLIGCWSGEDFQPVLQRKTKWFMNRRPDGTFSIEFGLNERGADQPVNTEEGKWNHKDGVYTTLTLRVAGTSVDTTDPQYTDSYEVKSVNDNQLTYYHPKMNLTFTSIKIACERNATLRQR